MNNNTILNKVPNEVPSFSINEKQQYYKKLHATVKNHNIKNTDDSTSTDHAAPSSTRIADLMKPHTIVCSSPMRRPKPDELRCIEACLTAEELAWVQEAVDVSLGQGR